MRQADPEKAVRDFGRRVAEERAKQGWTQAQFAELAEFSVRYLQGIEAGKENVTIKSAAVIANLLSVQLRVLFDSPTTKQRGPGRPARPGARKSAARRRA